MLTPKDPQDLSSTLLKFNQVSRTFKVKSGFLGQKRMLKAVNEVSFSLLKGECLGLVGESGCGKSTLGRLACGLLLPSKGSVEFLGKNLPQASADSWARGSIQMVFQDPFSALNPRMPVGDSIAEPLMARGISRTDRITQAEDMLATVGLRGVAKRYPHEFSGGQRQRIAIARALITKPELIVCDEPVSALDASVQAQVLNLLCEVQEKFAQAYLFISHDLNVVSFMCQRILVMYLGELVESAYTFELMSQAKHPYTQALLSARPGASKVKNKILQGELPSPINPPKGCPFHPRCPEAKDFCSKDKPKLKEIAPSHWVRCHLISS
ncbi:MAG: ATP-binding cassette domain-containing protein [Desulfovibrionaceae bacterium]|nr:ATP-binding cassette domain-containing protein [Desulfovibrionaceae bacterium]